MGYAQSYSELAFIVSQGYNRRPDEGPAVAVRQVVIDRDADQSVLHIPTHVDQTSDPPLGVDAVFEVQTHCEVSIAIVTFTFLLRVSREPDKKSQLLHSGLHVWIGNVSLFPTTSNAPCIQFSLADCRKRLVGGGSGTTGQK